MRFLENESFHKLNHYLIEKGLGQDIEAIADYLQSIRLPCGHERDVRRHLKDALDQAGIAYEMNVRIGKKGVVAFLIEGAIALFFAIDGGVTRIVNRLKKYAKNDRIDSIILVTSRNIDFGLTVGRKKFAVVRPGGYDD